MRSAGLLLAVISFPLLAISITARYRKRIELLKKLAGFFHSLSLVTVLNESEIINSVRKMMQQNGNNIPDFAESFINGYEDSSDIRQLWSKSIASSGTCGVLTLQARELLLSFSSVFGKRSLSYFREFCKNTENEFMLMYREEKSKYEKNGITVFALCLLTGVVLIIVFI